MTDNTKFKKVISGINVFRSWKLPNLIVLAVFIVCMTAVICFSGVTKADATRIDALNSRIEALSETILTLNSRIENSNDTIKALTIRLESYEKILGYRIENIEQKIGINYKEDNHNGKE